MTYLVFTWIITVLSIPCDTSVNLMLRPIFDERPAIQLIPSLYVVNIKPYMDTGDEKQFTFDGNIAITVRASVSDITQIRLHSFGLTFTSSDIGVQNSQSSDIIPLVPDSLIIDADSEHIVFRLTTGLCDDVDYVIRIVYRGTIRNDSTGLFRTEYLDNGVTKYLAATQLEPRYARRVFPCLDDPALKARFTFNIDRPDGYDIILANSIYESPSRTSTPPMSPFLVAFVICNFKRARHSIDDDHNELSFWTQSDFQDQTLFAFELSQRILTGFKERLGVDYYATDEIHKLDLVSFPGPTLGATQNWGLVKSREAFLLYHPEETNAFDKDNIAQTVSYGISDMFFGNLVTLDWWTDAWVNYGLSTYLGNYVLSAVEPSLEVSRVLITGTTRGGVLAAMKLDQSGQFPALVDGMHYPWSPDSSRVISFYKSAAIIRMIHHLIGHDFFKLGISRYLNKYQYNIASALDFYVAMQIGADGHNILEEYTGATISNVVSTWVINAGYPLLTVAVNRATKSITLSQNRFYENTYTSNELYAIPITYSTGSNPNFNDTKPKFIFDRRMHTFTENDLGEDDFIIFNNQFIGYMRVIYDKETWRKIAKILHSENRTVIHVLNRVQIVDDVFEFMIADQLALSIGFEVLNFLQEETNYHVWASAAFGISRLRNNIRINDTNRKLFEKRALTWMSLAIEELGFSENDNDDHTTKKHRSMIANLACQLGHTDCLNNASSYLNNFINDFQSVPTNLRSFAFCYGLKQGDGAAYDFLENYNTNDFVPSEFLTHRLNMGCTGVASRVARYLDQILVSKLTTGEDMARALLAPLRNSDNIHTVFNFLTRHFQAIEAKMGHMDFLMTELINYLYNEISLNLALTWIRGCTFCGDRFKESMEVMIKRRQLSFAWSDDNAEKLRSILSGVPSSTNTPGTLSSLIFVTIIILITYCSI